MSHLGTRVSALLDGRLRPEEEERCWQHVHACHPCRDLVEREGWVKTRLASWDAGPGAAPAHLKSSLLEPTPFPVADGVRSRATLALTGGAVGAAVVGVIALGVGPAAGPAVERRAPVSNLSGSTSVSWLEGPSLRAVRGALRPVADTRSTTRGWPRETMAQ